MWILLATLHPAWGVDFTSVDATGVFGDAGSRPCLVVPRGVTLTFDQEAPAFFDVLRVEGTIELVDGGPRILEANQIVVAADGRLEIGTSSDRFLNPVELRLTGAEDVGDCADAGIFEVSEAGTLVESAWSFEALHEGCGGPELDRTLRVQEHGQLLLHGDDRRLPWTRLAAPVEEGDAAFEVQGPTGWQVGDRVTIAGTDFVAEASEVVLDSVTVDPHTGRETWGVTDPAALGTHFVGTVGGSIVEAPEAANVTRNIRIHAPHPVASPLHADCTAAGFTTEAVELDGAEIRVETCGEPAAPSVRIEDVAVEDGGKFDRMGRYPLHLHMVGGMAGSYLRRVAVARSSNRGIVLHGTSHVEASDNVVLSSVGHAFYLEESEHHDTAWNTLRGNLALGVTGCPDPADDDTNGEVALFHDEHASGIFFTDPRNVLVDNAVAGVADPEHAPGWSCESDSPCDGLAHAGAAYWYAGGNEQNGLNLCGDAGFDYALAATRPLDVDLFAETSAWDDSEYALRAADGETCHGAFADNSAHGAPYGFWAGEHKEQTIRVTDFTAWKIGWRAVDVKNRGITEVVGLRVADSGTAVWPASHAHHLGLSPRFLLVDSLIVGESANAGSYPPRGDCLDTTCASVPMYGVEIYEGHVHVARTHFDGFVPGTGARAAFGRHQTFPFYLNDPHNSIEAVTFGAAQPLYFDPPVPGAQGFQMVLLRDLDGSLLGDPGSWLAADSPFLVPDTAAAFDPVANAWVVDGGVHHYGQVALQWCARSLRANGSGGERCDARMGRVGVPAPWWAMASDRVDFVKGLRVTDLREDDVLEASHSVNGFHETLGTNLLLERSYRLDLLDEDGRPLQPSDLEEIEAMQLHLRYGAAGAGIDVDVPVPDEPSCVAVYDGEDYDPQVFAEGDYDVVGDHVRLRPTLGPRGEQQSILLLFGLRCPE